MIIDSIEFNDLDIGFNIESAEQVLEDNENIVEKKKRVRRKKDESISLDSIKTRKSRTPKNKTISIETIKTCKPNKKNTKKDKAININNIETCKPNSAKNRKNKAININNIETCKPNSDKNGKNKQLNINTIETCKVSREKSTSGIKPLSVVQPKVTGNTFIGSVANKTYKQHKEEEKEADKLRLNRHPYVKRDGLLTNAEKYLYDFLVKNLPNTVTILIKVRLGDIIELNKQVTRDKDAFYKIACKHIDFLICDKSDLSIICALELDDFTHDTADRQERDRFIEEVLYECKIKLARIKFRIMCIEKSDIKEIENWIYEYQAPECPTCHDKMLVFESKRRKNFGHRFYGCVNFPNCRENIDID